MKKLFKTFDLKYYIANLSFGISYPIVKTIVSFDKVVAFSDTCLIMCCIFLIIAIFYNMYLKGDFDIVGFMGSRFFPKNKQRQYSAYKELRQEKRKDSTNYPFLVSLTLLILSLITSLIY